MRCAEAIETFAATFAIAASLVVSLRRPTRTTLSPYTTLYGFNTAFTTWLATASSSGGCNGSRSNGNAGVSNACGRSTTVTFTYTSSSAPTITTCAATFAVAAAPAVSLTCPTSTTAASCQTQEAINTAFTN